MKILILICSFIASTYSHHLRNRLSVYYESICPDSRRFILNQVVPLHEKFDQFIDLELVPFGNANVTYPNHDNKPVFQCQHGPDECYGNRAQACVIELIRNQKLSLNYVKCMFEDDEWKQPRITAEKCALRSNFNWDNLRDCIDGQQGDRFLVAYSHKTFNLNPNHNYIPWIVIDGKHSDQMQREGERNLIKYLCDNHYNHEPKLQQCIEAAQLSSSTQIESKFLTIFTLILTTFAFKSFVIN